MKKALLLALASLVLTINARAQVCTAPSPDHLFAGIGKSMVTVTTGIPYVGIAEYAYGISDKTTIGFMYGQTPMVEGYGIRIRTIIAEPTDRTRIYFRAPIFYYPKTHDLGGEPWFLSWPAFNIEYKRDCGRREWAGIGVIGACCAHSLGKTFGLEKDNDEMMGEGFKGGIWNTIQAGLTQPITDNLVAQGELGLVLKGFKIASKDDWVGGPPVVLVIGLNYNFQ